MRKLVIVPARAGSTRLKDKNIRSLAGKPLICHTLDAALSWCSKNDEVIFSTDSEKYIKTILKYYKKQGLTFGQFPESYKIPESWMAHVSPLRLVRRPAELASNTSKVIDTVRWHFDLAEDCVSLMGEFDLIVLMLPTCPIRILAELFSAETYFERWMLDNIVSVEKLDWPVELALHMNELGYIFPPDAFLEDNTRSQDFTPTYRPNGAFYMARWSSFAERRNFFDGVTKGYLVKRTVDIDAQEDFEYAEYLLERKYGTAE